MAKAPLQRAIEIAGGQSALARGIGTIQQNIWFWLNKANGRVPAEHCDAIERATAGAVTKQQLRPDIFKEKAA